MPFLAVFIFSFTANGIVGKTFAEQTPEDKECSSKLFGTVSKESCDKLCPKVDAKCFKTHEYPPEQTGMSEPLECYTCARDNQCSDIGAIDWWSCFACDVNPATECVLAGIALPFGGGPFGGKTWSGVQCYQCVPKPDRCSDVFPGTSWLASCQAACKAPDACIFKGVVQGNDCYKCEPTPDECLDMWAMDKAGCKQFCENKPNRKCVQIGMTSKFEPCFDCVKIKPEPPPPPPKGCQEIGKLENCDSCFKQLMGCLPTQAPNGQACYECVPRGANHCPPPSLNKWECPICEERGGQCIGKTRTKDDPDCYDCYFPQGQRPTTCSWLGFWESCKPNPCLDSQTCEEIQLGDDVKCAQCTDIIGYHQGQKCEQYPGKYTTCNECYKKKQGCRHIQVPEINEWCFECFTPSMATTACTPANDQALYKTVETSDVKSEVAMVLKQTCDHGCVADSGTGKPGAQVLLEVSILSRGSGEGGRNWVPEKPVLKVGDKTIKPSSQERFYVTKESVAKNAAVPLFAAIGGMYEGVAEEAAGSEGKVCPVTGKKLESETHERGEVARSIDRAGMAAGLGLLASQAKGQITGTRACFEVPKEAIDGNTPMVLKGSVRNEATQKTVYLKDIPVVGFLFAQQGKESENKDLQIMVTPQVVNDQQ